MNINRTLVSILAAIAIVPVSASAADLTLKVENLGENTGALHIAIFNEAGWSGNDAVAADIVEVSQGTDSIIFQGLEPGTYGVKLFHDVDGDGKLARGNFGIPTEPYGFSNDAPVRFGPPNFGDAEFALPTDGAVHTITLR